MSPHYLVKCTNFSSISFFHAYQVPIRDMDVLRKRLVATWAEFQQSVVVMQLIIGEKDWKHVSVQKVVTLNICCNVACLTFHLPHIATSSFQSHQHLEECNIPCQIKKLCILQGSAVTFFRCGG